MSPRPAKNPHSKPDMTNDGNNCTACRCLESILTMDGRGQLVIPKEVRKRAHIEDGDKLALVSWERGGTVCCLSLIKTETLSPDVSAILLPLMK